MKALLDCRCKKTLLRVTLTVTMLFFTTSAWSGSTHYCVENWMEFDVLNFALNRSLAILLGGHKLNPSSRNSYL